MIDMSSTPCERVVSSLTERSIHWRLGLHFDISIESEFAWSPRWVDLEVKVDRPELQDEGAGRGRRQYERCGCNIIGVGWQKENTLEYSKKLIELIVLGYILYIVV